MMRCREGGKEGEVVQGLISCYRGKACLENGSAHREASQQRNGRMKSKVNLGQEGPGASRRCLKSGLAYRHQHKVATPPSQYRLIGKVRGDLKVCNKPGKNQTGGNEEKKKSP